MFNYIRYRFVNCDQMIVFCVTYAAIFKAIYARVRICYRLLNVLEITLSFKIREQHDDKQWRWSHFQKARYKKDMLTLSKRFQNFVAIYHSFVDYSIRNLFNSKFKQKNVLRLILIALCIFSYQFNCFDRLPLRTTWSFLSIHNI